MEAPSCAQRHNRSGGSGSRFATRVATVNYSHCPLAEDQPLGSQHARPDPTRLPLRRPRGDADAECAAGERAHAHASVTFARNEWSRCPGIPNTRFTCHAKVVQGQEAARIRKLLLDLIRVHEDPNPLGLQVGLDRAFAGSVWPSQNAQAWLCRSRRTRLVGLDGPLGFSALA